MQIDNYLWFVDHYDDLRKQYGNAFLVIKEKQVLNAYQNYGEAVRETQRTELLGSFIVQECLRDGTILDTGCRLY